MKSANIDLGLAIAACARGLECKRRQYPDETMKLVDHQLLLVRLVGKDCRVENSALWLDITATDWYIVGDDLTWIDKGLV